MKAEYHWREQESIALNEKLTFVNMLFVSSELLSALLRVSFLLLSLLIICLFSSFCEPWKFIVVFILLSNIIMVQWCYDIMSARWKRPFLFVGVVKI